MIFKKHPYIDDMYIAKFGNGCSVIHGRFVDGYEVLDANGDTRSFQMGDLKSAQEYVDSFN